jgi:hypothetical protein
MKEMRGKLNNTVEGIMNQGLAVGLPLLEPEYRLWGQALQSRQS